jgi:hypothetical protein
MGKPVKIQIIRVFSISSTALSEEFSVNLGDFLVCNCLEDEKCHFRRNIGV